MTRITVWRLVHSEFKHDAFSGIGAEERGGRFNSVGRPLVYAAESISLGLLELLVWSNDLKHLKLQVCLSASFDDSLVLTRESDDLPAQWDARPYQAVSQQVGDTWIKEQSSCVLRVPSVVVPLEYNYLINPLHPDFSEVEIGTPAALPFDDRLVG